MHSVIRVRFRPEAVGGIGESERRYFFCRQMMELPGQFSEVQGSAGDGIDVPGTQGGAGQKDVVERENPLFIDAFQTEHHAHNGTDVAEIAVGIAAGFRNQAHGFVEVIASVQHAVQHDGSIRENMADAFIFVIAMMRMDVVQAGPGILRMRFMEGKEFIDQCRIGTLRIQVFPALFDDCACIVHMPGKGDAGRNEPASFDAVQIMGNRAHLCSKVRGFLRIAQGEESPAVGEDLSADLLSDGLSVDCGRAGSGRFDAVLQIGVGGMFGSDARSAPPVETVQRSDNVEHIAAHVFRGYFFYGVILHGPDKEQRSVEIIVCSVLPVIRGIAVDRGIGLPDLFPGPVLYGRTQAYTDAFSQPGCVDPAVSVHEVHKSYLLAIWYHIQYEGIHGRGRGKRKSRHESVDDRCCQERHCGCEAAE